MRNMSLQMQMSPEHVPENTISSDQPYTAHIMVSVFPMFPLRPIKPPPDEKNETVNSQLRETKRESERERRGLTGFVPKLHMFNTSRDELVRKVGIDFDNKYLVLTAAERVLMIRNII